VLNIKGHRIGIKEESEFIYGPTDIGNMLPIILPHDRYESPNFSEFVVTYILEGHIGRDKRYYLLDFSRTFPPEFPAEDQPKRSVLYNLLRPEFSAKFPKPLSSVSPHNLR
jgi:hypothetical protein